MITPRQLSLTASLSYLVIFFAAIFANFFVLDGILQNPVEMVQQNHMLIRLGTLAFLITVVFDVVVAWALYELYKNHILSRLSTYFRLMHATIMGIAIFTLPLTLTNNTAEAILNQVNTFNIIWLIGLFFFGIHLILVAKIIKLPKFITWFLVAAGVMYMVDTSAHFLLENYENYASILLALVAIPSILGEMAFAIWLLVKGGK